MSAYVYRLSADGKMYSLAATTAAEAASDVERLLTGGAEQVEIERVERAKVDDLEDVWNTKAILASARSSS